MTRREFADLLQRMNADSRSPGGCTPAVCRAAEVGGETLRVIQAVLGFETATRRDADGHYTRPGRMATVDDLEAVAERALAVGAGGGAA